MTKAIVPTVPKWAKETDVNGMKERALTLYQDVKEKTGPALTRAIDVIGKSSQQRMTAANDSMRNSVNSLLSNLGGESPTADLLLDLRGTMDAQNPKSVYNSVVFKWMPASIKRKMVRKFVVQYQSLNTHVSAIFDGLKAGKDELLETNLELEMQYKEVEAAKREVEAEIHVGEILFSKLQELEAAGPEDEQERQKLNMAMNKVARRIRDLQTMRQAAVQFFISIDQTVEGNELLMEQIDSAITVGPMIMTNALRIQSALEKQRKNSQALNAVQEGMSDMMLQNAEAINRNTDQIVDLYNNPVLAVEQMQKSHDQLMEAVSKSEQARLASTQKAREITACMETMTASLEPIAAGLHEVSTTGKEVLPEMQRMIQEGE